MSAEETPDSTALTTAGLSRRRDASRRMVPFACGHRDPLDCAGEPTEAQRRALANELASDGWDLEYLARRYRLAPAGGAR